MEIDLPEHYVSVTFSGDGYLSINNKGAQFQRVGKQFHGVRIVKIPKHTQLDEIFFKKLISRDLDLYTDIYNFPAIYEVPQKEQKTGNCTMANRRSAVLASLVFFREKKLRQEHPNLTMQERFEHAKNLGA